MALPQCIGHCMMMASSLFSCISKCKQQDVHVYEEEEHGAAILQFELRGLLTTTNRCLCLMAQSSKVSFNSTIQVCGTCREPLCH